MEALLASSTGINMDQTHLANRTQLNYACESKPGEAEPKSTAELPIERGARHLPDNYGVTPFHIVCRQKCEDVVKLLLKRIGPEGDTQVLCTRDQYGGLPIHYMVPLQLD